MNRTGIHASRSFLFRFNPAIAKFCSVAFDEEDRRDDPFPRMLARAGFLGKPFDEEKPDEEVVLPKIRESALVSNMVAAARKAASLP